MEYNLNEVFEFIRNGANIKQLDTKLGYPITRIETIANSHIDIEKMGYANIEELGKFEEYLLKDGDILMSHINSEKHLGKSAIYENINEDIIHGMNLLCLRPNKILGYPKYLNYFFNSNEFRRQLPKITKKSVNQASFSVTDLKKLKVYLPNMQIQQKVVEVLDKAQELIDKRKEQIEALDELVKSKFIEMFGNPVRNEKGWSKEICKSISFKIGSGATPKGGNSSYKDEGISLIRSMNVHNNKFVNKDLAFIDDEQAEKLKNVTIEHNDVLLNITGASVARCCTVPDKYIPARVNQHVAIIRCNDNLILPKFLEYQLTNENYQRLLWDIATSGGATREAITKQQIENLELIVPELEVQNKFVDFVKQVDKLKFELEKSLKELEDNFNSLMQRAFKGELFQ